MNRVIREGVFETNSSSSHSISIAEWRQGAKPSLLNPRDDGVVRIYPGEFGREVEDYYDPASKASYAYVYARDYGTKENMEMLRKVISAETESEVEFVEGDGYIDHQSSDVCAEAFDSREALRSFIFNPDSVLHTDNDNN